MGTATKSQIRSTDDLFINLLYSAEVKKSYLIKWCTVYSLMLKMLIFHVLELFFTLIFKDN